MNEKMPTIEQTTETLKEFGDNEEDKKEHLAENQEPNQQGGQIERGGWTEGHQEKFLQRIAQRKKLFLERLFGEYQAKRIPIQPKGKVFTPEEFVKVPEDPQGILYVFDKDNGNFRKLSTRMIKKSGFDGLDFSVGKNCTFAAGPKETLVNFFQDELNQGVIKFDDFEQKSGTDTYGIIRTERKISKRMKQISFDRANYYLQGNSYPGTEIKIERGEDRAVMLTPELVAFVGKRHGDDYIKCTLKLLSDQELEIGLLNKGKNPFLYINAKEVAKRINPWQITENNPKRADETAEQYAERIRSLSDIGFIRKLSDDLSKETQVGMHNLSLREQQNLATYAYNNEKKIGELFDFTRKYQLNGLKSFLAAEYGDQNGDKILTIGDNLESKEAKVILLEYNKVLAKAEDIYLIFKNSEFIKQSPVAEEIKCDLSQQVYEAISRRTKDIINVAYALAKNDEARVDFYGRQEIDCENKEEVIKALRILSDSLDKLESVLQPNSQEINYKIEYLNSTLNNTNSYHFKLNHKQSNQESYLTIQTKAIPQRDQEIDRAREFDGEARINFLFNDKPISELITDPSRAEAVSIRLDREGWIRKNGELVRDQAGKPIHDPTIDETEISLDLGSIYHADKNLKNAVLGRMVALGNALDNQYANERKKKNPQYFHNRESFSKSLADKETFSKIVRFIEQLIEQKFGL